MAKTRARAKAPSLRSLLTAGKTRAARAVISSRVKRVASALRASSSNVSPEEKAVFHSITGAGKSRVVRDFFNVGTADAAWVHEFLAARVARHLAQPGKVS